MSQPLRDARRYEEERERLIPPQDRPAFHLSARVGWMNDPNGFSFHDGQVPPVLSIPPLRFPLGADALGPRGQQRPAALALPARGPGPGHALRPGGLLFRQRDHAAGRAAAADVHRRGRGDRPGRRGAQVQTQNLAFGDGSRLRQVRGQPGDHRRGPARGRQPL